MQPPARLGCDPNSISVSALFPDPFNLNMRCNAACLHSEYISYVDVINGIDLSTQVSHLTPPIVSWWFLACIQTQQTSQQLFSSRICINGYYWSTFGLELNALWLCFGLFLFRFIYLPFYDPDQIMNGTEVLLNCSIWYYNGFLKLNGLTRYYKNIWLEY